MQSSLQIPLRRTDEANLRRIAFIGDVPVESSYHGSALLYRLFSTFEPIRLRIVETNLACSLASRRLPGVAYSSLWIGHPRPLFTRFAPYYRSLLLLRAACLAGRIRQMLGDFAPEAVVSVTHGYAWRTAERLSRDLRIPLHLVCHDDLPNTGQVPYTLLPWLDRVFGRALRYATTRLCVSPAMCESYSSRYHCSCRLLYPSRDASCRAAELPSDRLARNSSDFAGAYAGSVNSPGYAAAVRRIAEQLGLVGGRLLLFTPLSLDSAKRIGLVGPSIDWRGLVPSHLLIERLRDEADFLFVPMSFDPADKWNMELSFPSKLTDYTAAGVPLLIWGPSYCSAVRWAREHEGVAEVVDNVQGVGLDQAIARIQGSALYRLRLASRAIEVGEKLFSHAIACRTFCEALASS